MRAVNFKRTHVQNSYRKHECSAESVIEVLKEKMSRLQFRLLDCQNQNQMLRKELLLAKKVIKTEVTKASNEEFQDLLNQTDFRGRQERILSLKDKIAELQNRIMELEDGSAVKSPEVSANKLSKVDKQDEYKVFQSKKMIDKELQYLLENSCQIKRKVEVWKKRNTELNKELEVLRLDVDRLLEKGKEDRGVQESYRKVDKELRARQSEKLNIRSKLDLEKTRNEQLTEELAGLKEDLSTILSKINDDKVLIDALKNQQGNLFDLLERQRLISESNNRKFQDDLSEMQVQHATNNHILDHLRDIIEEKTKACQQVQESLKQEMAAEESQDLESTVTITTDSEWTPQSESHQSTSTIPASEQPSDIVETPPDNEKLKLTEEVQQYKNILQSVNEEVEQLSNIVLSNNKKTNEWMSQLLKTNSLLAQKNAEIRELEETLKKLQKPCLEKKESTYTPQGPNASEEFLKKNDVLKEEYQFLLSLCDLLISDKENSLEVFFVSVEFPRNQFIAAILNLINEEDYLDVDEESASAENEEQS